MLPASSGTPSTGPGPTGTGPLLTGPGPATTATGPAVAVAPRSFDPLRLTLSVGLHPAAFTEEQQQTGTDRQAVSFVPPGPVGGSGLYVSVLTRGGSFGSDRSFGMEGGRAAEPPDPAGPRWAGDLPHRAVRLPALAVRAGRLGLGVLLRRRDEDPAVIAATTRRIAESVTLTAGRPVRMPFRITGATARLAVTSTLVEIHSPGRTGSSGERWTVDLTLNRSGSKQPADTYGSPRGVSLGLMDRAASAGPLPDGRDAW